MNAYTIIILVSTSTLDDAYIAQAVGKPIKKVAKIRKEMKYYTTTD